ncbi:MAG TPA: GAF domain-containing protein, partial [Syntrophorhabdaceae bacterium]|nr:GAF domain-containing protein [Syntrophorhabdaceae bacterium]
SRKPLAVNFGECGAAWWIHSGQPVMPHEWASARALQEGETIVGQLLRIRKADGDEVFVHNSTAPVYDAAGKVIGSVIAVMDISEQQRAKSELKETVERLDIVSSTASQLLFTSDPQEIVNDLCVRVMRHLDCHVFFNYLVDEETDSLRLNAYGGIPEQTAESIRTLQYGVAVCGCVARDGSWIVAEDISTTKDPRTKLVASLGVQAYACHPLYAMGKVIGTLSFGTCSRKEFQPKDIALMKTVADQVAVAMERRRLLESERLRADDLERRVERRTSELSEAYERLQTEMAERARIEEQLRQSQKMEAMGTLAGGIAHDFNNILAGIMGFAEMVEEDLPPDSPSVQRIQKVLKAAARGKDLVRQILAFSRKTKVNRMPLSVTPIIQETIQLLRASMPTTIKIELDLAAERDIVVASPEEPQQIVMNLATNGYNAMRKS